MGAPAAVVGTDSQVGNRALGVDTLGREGTVAGKDGNHRKQEAAGGEDDCNRNQVAGTDCILAVDTCYNCTVVGAAVVAAALHTLPCRSDLAVEDMQVDNLAADRDCNYNNYCNHNQRVECCRFFLLGLAADLNFEGWQWCHAAFPERHLKENPATNPHSPLRTDRPISLRRDRCLRDCPTRPGKNE